MTVYKKALPFLLTFALIITFAACSEENKSMSNDNTLPENSAPSFTPNSAAIEENRNMENLNQFGGTWPDNEFTRQVPRPEFEVYAVTTNATSCNITFSGTTIEQLKDYVEVVKDAGFTTTITRESEIRGVKHYLYTARNANGYEIVVTQSVSYGILSIIKLA